MTIMQERFPHFLCRQPGLPVGGESCADDDYRFIGTALSPLPLPLIGRWHVHTCRTPPGEGGVARRKGGVSPPLEGSRRRNGKGRSEAAVCTSEARKIGEALAPREGGALRKAWFPYLFALVRALDLRGGVAGRNRPAEAGREGGDRLPHIGRFRVRSRTRDLLARMYQHIPCSQRLV